jgi:hypothetical protein
MCKTILNLIQIVLFITYMCFSISLVEGNFHKLNDSLTSKVLSDCKYSFHKLTQFS